MATKIILRDINGDVVRIRPVTREVETRSGRELIVTLGETGITFREKGRRKRFGPLEYGAAYIDVVRRTVDATKRARKRKGKK